MSRPQWIKSMVDQGMSEEAIIAEIQKGNEAEGIKPCPELTFAKLNYKKVVNPKKK